LEAKQASESEKFLLAQKIREALFKSGLISGYPKVSVDFTDRLLCCADAGIFLAAFLFA
jgi:hypothetical protein